ncbi:hypothetical protein [Halobacillus sp. A5]|uniref:hypothetical protein n=1 Tax=Halobacillus sp. A5 TaxID=2880263 RepID=UPI0020A64F2B|nr:hypothetical protein [Halobacillus sp. A5]MCP3027168.1 hypothetical protein [Halobacillus sp. A5]
MIELLTSSRLTIKQAVGFGNTMYYYNREGEQIGEVKGNRIGRRTLLSRLLHLLRFSTWYSHYYQLVDPQDLPVVYFEKEDGAAASFHIYTKERKKLYTLKNRSRLQFELVLLNKQEEEEAV